MIERSLPTGAITPERQIGLSLGKTVGKHLAGAKDLLTYYAGIFNGNGRNITVNDNNNFMYRWALGVAAVRRQSLWSALLSQAGRRRAQQPR